MAKPSPAELGLEKIQKSRATKFKVAVTDIDGVLRGKYINKNKLESVLESGLGFCNVVLGWDMGDVCYDNSRYTGWQTGYPDAQVRLDLSTYREVPWDGGVPFLLGEFVDELGHPLPICPRQLLKRVLARAEKAGFDVMAAFEYEFFNFRETPRTLEEAGYVRPETLTPGMFGYSLLRLNQHKDYVNALLDDLAGFDVPIEGLHTETGPGVMEAALLYSEALEAADRAVLFKASAKEIAHRFGIMPSFMAKWRSDLPGCSGHIHQSLWHGGKKNVFYAGGAPRELSQTFQHYIAGQLRCLPEILPLFAPTINSYKRLVEGAWAPTKANWGVDNRTTALRAIPGGKKSSRLETRVNGSDSNPYLALAAAVASGIYGIEHALELQPAVAGNGYADKEATSLPANLAEATERFAASELTRELFGDEFVEHFAASRRWEWRQFGRAVTDWEVARYFEII